MAIARRAPGLWVGQPLHFISLGALCVLSWMCWTFLGQPQAIAFWCAMALPIVHQVFVWLAWRNAIALPETSGSTGFRGYVAVFFVLFAGRFAACTGLVGPWQSRPVCLAENGRGGRAHVARDLRHVQCCAVLRDGEGRRR